jgi:membrane protein DedA with SNARE-associated domain
MNPVVFLVIAILIIGATVGSLINFGFGFLALPFLFVFGWLAVGKESLQRQKKIQQMKRFRRDAKARKVEFDEDDKKTIAV